MKEFKDDVSFKVTVESTAPHKVNQGVVGPMGDAKGGAGQVEFLGNKNLKVVGQPQALPVRAPVEVPKAPQVNGPVAKPHVAPEAPKAPEAKPQARPVVEPQRGAPAPLETKPSARGATPVNDGPGTVNAPAASKSVALGEKPPAYFTECFVAGTLVHTAEGGKRIEDIVVGDMVAARDEVNKTTTFKPVMQLFLVEGKEIVHVSVRTASGESDIISTTNEHPFFVHQDWWRGASDLKAGDQLELLEGGIVEVTGVRVDAELATTYNFEVADVHTYFVGKLGVWVHNTCSMKYADGAPTLSTPAVPTIARGPVTGPALPVRNAGLNTTSPAAASLNPAAPSIGSTLSPVSAPLGNGASSGIKNATVRGPYRGGPHSETRLPVNDKLDSHHMPDRNADPRVTANEGPAIKMDPIDHAGTSSNGQNGRAGAIYRAQTADMISKGRYRDAMAREARDVRRAAAARSGDIAKYNEAMKEMLGYARSSGQLPVNPRTGR